MTNKPDRDRLERKLVIRIRDDQYDLIRAWAEESEVGISVLVRSLIKRETTRRETNRTRRAA